MQVVKHGRFTIRPLRGLAWEPVWREACALLDADNVYVDAGTLLGIWRDNRLIPHDTDLDFACVADRDRPAALDLPGFRLIRTQHHGVYPMQTAFEKNGVIVDIYYFWRDSEHDVAVNHSDVGIMRVPLDMVFPLVRSRFAGATVNLPLRTDEYLCWRYGPDWRTPATEKRTWDCDAACLDRRGDAGDGDTGLSFTGGPDGPEDD